MLNGLLNLAHVPSKEQLADLLTKVLPPQQQDLLFKLGMFNASHPSACAGMRICNAGEATSLDTWLLAWKCVGMKWCEVARH